MTNAFLIFYAKNVIDNRSSSPSLSDYVKQEDSDPKIRLVTICDLDGKIMHSDPREGVKNLLTPQESKKSLDLAVNSWKTRSELAPKIGKGQRLL
jgi:hypothetical protein